MIIRELKINLKGLIIWSSIIIFMYLLVFLIYPTIWSDPTQLAMLDEMLKIFPEELLKAFNMDIGSISTASGWIKSEGIVLYHLLIGIYSALLGSSLLLKEESEKTIEFLFTKPISRNQIIFTKIISGVINITMMILIITLFTSISLILVNEFTFNLLLLYLSSSLLFYVLFFIMFFIATFFDKLKQSSPIAYGVVFISYFLQIIGLMSDKYEWIKYFSLFTLADTRNIISNGYLNPLNIIVAIILINAAIIGAIYKYNQKELV